MNEPKPNIVAFNELGPSPVLRGWAAEYSKTVSIPGSDGGNRGLLAVFTQFSDGKGKRSDLTINQVEALLTEAVDGPREALDRAKRSYPGGVDIHRPFRPLRKLGQ